VVLPFFPSAAEPAAAALERGAGQQGKSMFNSANPVCQKIAIAYVTKGFIAEC
jgi:hypothetical protein